MTIFSNFINQGVTKHSKIKALRYFGLRYGVQETQQTLEEKWKKRIEIAMKVLE